MKKHILVVDDQPEVRELLGEVLTSRGHDVSFAGSAEAALSGLTTEGADQPHLIVLDLDFGPGHMNGLDLLAALQDRRQAVPTIILTGKGTIGSAVAALKMGAIDFLQKDEYLEDALEISMEKAERLVNALHVQRALKAENAALRREREYARERLCRQYETVGTHPAWLEVVNRAKALASVPRPVLICGERGTGKEHIAAIIHNEGERANGPFVVVNCAALAEGLLECELFGQEANAYDGAPFKLGRFEMANNGTLFLDEIGNMSLEFQAKILRVLEYQQFERVQGTETISVDVRVIAATNTDLEQVMEAGRFRWDLYDRLAFQRIRLPPLRERKSDIPALAVHFVGQFATEVPGVGPKAIAPEVLELLAASDWPGNVRELKNAVESALLHAEGDSITVEDLPLQRRPVEQLAICSQIEGDDHLNFAEKAEAFQKHLLLKALEATDWHQRNAATALGLKYDQFRHLYRKYQLASLKSQA